MADVRITSIDQVQTGLFIKFVDRDKNGRFTYTGEVTAVSIDTKKPKKKEPGSAGYKRDEVHVPDHSFEMLTFDGTMGFEMGNPEEDHELYITTTKPPGWTKFKNNPELFNANKAESEVVTPVTTKKEQVLELVAGNRKKSEGALLKLAKKQIGGTCSNFFIQVGMTLLYFISIMILLLFRTSCMSILSSKNELYNPINGHFFTIFTFS